MKLYVTAKELTGIFAKWIVSQSPAVPTNMTEILSHVAQEVGRKEDELRVLTFESEEELRDYINGIVFGSPLLTDLNVSQAEQEGKNVPDILFTSRYDSPDPRYDFVDLDALTNNIRREVVQSQID